MTLETIYLFTKKKRKKKSIVLSLTFFFFRRNPLPNLRAIIPTQLLLLDMIKINHVKCCNKFYASPTSWVTNLPTLWKIKSKVTSIQDKFRWFNNGESREGRGGRVIRGHDREWLTGYARPLGQTNSCMAELWALRDGLMLAKELGLNNLIIELDVLSVVLLMNNNTSNMLM